MSSHSRALTPPALALALALALAALSARPAAAQPAQLAPCAPGSYFTGTSCSPCVGATAWSFGSAGACATSCPAGSTFVSSSQGCAPSLPAGLPPPAFFFSGTASEGYNAFAQSSSAPSGFLNDHLGTSQGAIALTPGASLSTAPLPAAPTGQAARTLSAWVQCPAPSSSYGRTVLDLWDGTGSVFPERFTLVAQSTSTGSSSITFPTYYNSLVAGQATFACKYCTDATPPTLPRTS